ncbi:unnamed protein product, partial [Musa acuminata subsp. burmannicoides]
VTVGPVAHGRVSLIRAFAPTNGRVMGFPPRSSFPSPTRLHNWRRTERKASLGFQPDGVNPWYGSWALKTHRRRQRWADKAYKKSHLGNEWKKPFAGSSHAKGIVLEKM